MFRKRKDPHYIDKAIATINETMAPEIPQNIKNPRNQRGLQVYSYSQLRAITGIAQDGARLTGNVEQSITYLSYDERIAIFRLCTPVMAVVSSRMNTISSMEYDIVSEKEEEERVAQKLKNLKSIFKEYEEAQDIKYQVARKVIADEIILTLPECLPDLSNFDQSLVRWKKRIQDMKVDQADQIRDWMQQPNINDRYEEFVKKLIFDLMIHGSCAIYKEKMNDLIENIYSLPGGTVIPIKNKYVGGANAYVQVTNGVDVPQIYFSNELSYANYIPTSARAYGFIPLEALVNKVAETLLFDKLMADQADGTKPPEKMVIVTNPSPFGDLDKEFDVPVDADEQQRIQEMINTPIKNAIRTLTGNKAEVVDLSRENTMQIQMERQKMIREEVGLIFQATPIEMNLTGSENTSGRSTSEAQREIYHSKGILPIIKIVEMIYNQDVFPFRFGPGWSLEYKGGKTEEEDLALLQSKVQTGLWSINELRQAEINEPPIVGDEFDKPTGAPPDMGGMGDMMGGFDFGEEEAVE